MRIQEADLMPDTAEVDAFLDRGTERYGFQALLAGVDRLRDRLVRAAREQPLPEQVTPAEQVAAERQSMNQHFGGRKPRTPADPDRLP